MSFKLPDRVRMTVSGAPGTGDVSLGAATSGFQALSAGLSDGDTFSYVIEDVGSAWEVGVGTYHSAGPSFSRTTVRCSSGGGTSKISATSAAIVYSAICGEDVGGSPSLASLSDVLISAPTNNQVLTYNTGASKWENATPSGGGGVGGTPPALVQFGSALANSAAFPSVTLGAAPANGDLLLAIVYSGNTCAAASGWTLLNSYTGSGSWYVYVFTKTAGSSESATQTPCTGSSTNSNVGIWEFSGQNASPIVASLNHNTGITSNFITTDIMVAKDSTAFVAAITSNSSDPVIAPTDTSAVDVNYATGSNALGCVFGHYLSNHRQTFGLSGVLSGGPEGIYETWVAITA